MSVPHELDVERTERLRQVVGTDPIAAPPKAQRGRRTVGRLARAALRPFDRIIRARFAAALAPLELQLADLQGLSTELRGIPVNFELLKAEAVAAHAVATNLELLKAEFRGLLAQVEELGRAIAPGAGLEGASVRIAELREQVNALDRRLRHNNPLAAATPAAVDAGPPAAAAPQSALFDYVGFERRFRGDPDAVLAVQSERYESTLLAHQPVLDVGCGRGELLGALAAKGATVVGVDTDPAMVAEARSRGLDVHEEDAVSFLRRQPTASLGSIVALHVAEHLELDGLIELLELAASRLVPGGVLVAETPNPASLIVLGNSYILDPTHVRPLHPSLFSFLCEGAGFRDIRLEFYTPAEAYHLQPVDGGGAAGAQINAAFVHLNHVLFGPQEYAIVATTPNVVGHA